MESRPETTAEKSGRAEGLRIGKQTSQELSEFQKSMLRCQLPYFSLVYLRKNKDDVSIQLKSITTPHNRFYGMDYGDLSKETLYSISCAALVLAKQALEQYCVGVHHGDRDASDIQNRLPEFRLRCCNGGPEYHIAKILKELRDRFIHSNDKYNDIVCSKSPLDVWSQRLIVKRFENHKKIHFYQKGIADGLKEISGEIESSYTTSVLTYGELLLEELMDCVVSYDRLRTPYGFRRRIVKANASRIEYE